MPIWLAPWKKHARCNSHPRKRVREIHQLDPPSKPPQLSPCRVFVRPGESIRRHPEGSTVGRCLTCREAERTVSGAGGRSRRHSLGRPVTKVHVTMGVRQGSVEGLLCFILLYALSINAIVSSTGVVPSRAPVVMDDETIFDSVSHTDPEVQASDTFSKRADILHKSGIFTSPPS